MDNNIKYANEESLRAFLDNSKLLFATNTDVDELAEGVAYINTTDNETITDVTPESTGSGIHIGSDAPTDGSQVWIDTDENGESAGGANIDVVAEVGQTIRVKEVDANGKPTKWEAADYPLTVNEIIPQTTYTGEYDSTYSCYVWNFRSDTKLIAGQTYTVWFDGIKYTCTAKSGSLGDMNFTFIGNGAIIGDNTGEPFALASIAYVTGYITLLGFDGNEHTMSLSNIKLADVYVPQSAYPYYIKVTGSGTDDDPYVCNETVANVKNITASGREIHLKLYFSAAGYNVYYLSQYAIDDTFLALAFTNPLNYAGGGDALNKTLQLVSTDGETFKCAPW